MKWTADNDQLLFMKLIETHDVSIKAEKIRDAWPKDRVVPTARAITERIFRIRNSVKNSAGSSTPSTPRKRKGAESSTSTPGNRKIMKDESGSKSPTKRVKRPAANTRTREESEGTSFDGGLSEIFHSFDGFQEEGRIKVE